MTDLVTPPVIDTIPAEIPRDSYGRPRVKNPAGKVVSYTRCTTFVSCLEDTWNLSKWSQRNVAIGLSERKDLLLAVSAHRDDKTRLNELCDEAARAAGDRAAATTGTALHKIAEKVDRGIDPGVLPDGVDADVTAYLDATKDMTAELIETFCVHDLLKVGGTPDRVIRWKGETGQLRKGKRYIADLKTGASLDFGVAKMAMQLAVYAHSRGYDLDTGARYDHGAELDKGLIVWLPAGQGRCEVYVIDLGKGWDGVTLARQVREWRSNDKRDTFLVPVTAGDDITQVDPDPVRHQIVTAASVEDLGRVWREHKHTWTDVHTAAAAARKTELEAAS